MHMHGIENAYAVSQIGNTVGHNTDNYTYDIGKPHLFSSYIPFIMTWDRLIFTNISMTYPSIMITSVIRLGSYGAMVATSAKEDGNQKGYLHPYLAKMSLSLRTTEVDFNPWPGHRAGFPLPLNQCSTKDQLQYCDFHEVLFLWKLPWGPDTNCHSLYLWQVHLGDDYRQTIS